MRPTARDFIGPLVLTLVLVGLVALLFFGNLPAE
ncbi:MAG: hypothetical protein RL338_1699 [Chloroflexota bacterium]|jgi:hypothetical protein